MIDLEPFFAGDIRALSRVITRIENDATERAPLLGTLYKRAGRTLRIGITGPPGAGKSTLVNCLSHGYLAEGKRVGIVAVDPSSPFTGGALLGDRVRMHEFPTDGKIYFRSMATRGAAGGLAATTQDVTVALDAFGFDMTLIETVGVGQVELDIMDACDVVVVVVVPESGDAVQTMKAGLMEIANVFAVNKADRPGAEKLGNELQHTLHLRKRIGSEPEPAVILTDAVNRKNVDQLADAISTYLAWSHESGEFMARRRRQITSQIASFLRQRFHEEFVASTLADDQFERYLDDIVARARDPYAIGVEIFSRFKASRQATATPV